MVTIIDSLKSVNAYPIPLRTIVETAERRGVSLAEEATQEVLKGRNYNLAVADLLLWLSLAPSISQGGQSYSFTDVQRAQFRNRAYVIYDEYKDADRADNKPIYGYKGSRL